MEAVPIPRQPGTYVLWLGAEGERWLQVGRLGAFRLPPGWLAYVGSARGPGGLAARLSRHLRPSRPLHWHVDFLLLHARPAAVWWAVGTEREECRWADALARMPGASRPIPGFGASDCRCPAHLFHFPTLPEPKALLQALGDEGRALAGWMLEH